LARKILNACGIFVSVFILFGPNGAVCIHHFLLFLLGVDFYKLFAISLRLLKIFR